jgi:formate dehydrogenase subunit gamma
MTAPRIVRYAFRERLMHGLAAISYVYLLLTGLAFWTPALYWLSTMLGGGYLSRVLHPWVGVVFGTAVVWMFVAWRRDMRATPEDRAWNRAIRHYIRNEDNEVPPVWRFNPGQKQLFWLMFFGGAVLLVSGLVMWLVASVPGELRGVRSIATLVHAVAALATIAGFIIHIYMGLAVVPDGLHAVVHGDVTEEWARRHHPLWLAQVQSGADPKHSTPDSRPPTHTNARARG